jgi:tRNA (guanine37-N1)-methyltransferase
MKFYILTILPGYFEGPFREGVLGKAVQRGDVKIEIINIRNFAEDPHRTVDDLPYGGGEGMVLKPEPIVKAIESVKNNEKKQRVIAMTPAGRLLNQKIVRELSEFEEIIIICGRYEGIDERVLEHFCDDLISIGDYVLTGGEPAAIVLIDAVSRFVPGVVGNRKCVEEDSFSRGLLDYPQWTRPAVFRGIPVPEILLSGNHKEIRKWRMMKAIERTLKRRPEIIREDLLTEEEREILNQLKAKMEK